MVKGQEAVVCGWHATEGPAGQQVLDTLQTRAKRARIETTSSLGVEVQSEYKSLQRGFASTSRNIESAVGRVVSETTSLSSATETYHKISRNELSSATNATNALAEHGAQPDTPTGTTPRKRVCRQKYRAHLQLPMRGR
ncbi:hypothetical protein B0H14DRAFT_2645079 [Mycena olivaceomarginata]|nr:hypothetical protein B0H14DRAFT_2645079 [Mycena olivaceomarginata]